MRPDVDALYRTHGEAVWRYVRARVPAADAEDVASEVFLRAMRSRTYDPAKGTEVAWLLGIARNVTADHWRRSRPEDPRDVPPDQSVGDEPAEATLALDEAGELHRHLAHLSEREREALSLRFGAELASEDIGAALGISATAARMLVHRAVTKLRGVMA